MKQNPVLYELNLIYKEMDEFYHNLCVRLGLSDSAFIVLYCMCVLGDGCLQRDICRLAFISKQTVNSCVRKLEQEGLLFAEAGRGRDQHLFLTETGRSLCEEKIRPVMELEQNALGRMGEDASRELLELSARYLKLLRSEADSAAQN